MRVLGISAFHRDAAAALLVDGVPVAAAQEERFTKKRLDPAFPRRAVRFCLDKAGIRGAEVDQVVFYEKPLRKFERFMVTQLKAFPRSTRSFSRGMFLWLGDRLWIKQRLADEVGVSVDRVAFTEHQRAHAAGAFFTSPFEEAAVLTVDDAGEWATTSLARGAGNGLEVLAEIHFPHSLGLFVSAVTQFLGFEPGAEEEHMEALARFGTPRFRDDLARLVPEDGGSRGAFRVDQSAFRFSFDLDKLFDDGLEELLGAPRFPGSVLRATPPDTRDADVAASLQRVVEERVLALCAELHERVPVNDLCFAGELARNKSLNARILADGPFRRLFVAPVPDEAGAALGAALHYHHVTSGGARAMLPGTGLGEAIDGHAQPNATLLDGPGGPVAELARRLTAGECVGWARGCMDFGARSFGNRSILAEPGDPGARERLLGAVQKSESFLPCRVALPAERAGEYLELPAEPGCLMRFAQIPVRARAALENAAPAALLPGGAVWPQLVDADVDPDFHALLHRVGAETGAPLLLHATLNLRGSPMARTELDAVEVFQRSRLDCLVVEDRLYARD